MTTANSSLPCSERVQRVLPIACAWPRVAAYPGNPERPWSNRLTSSSKLLVTHIPWSGNCPPRALAAAATPSTSRRMSCFAADCLSAGIPGTSMQYARSWVWVIGLPSKSSDPSLADWSRKWEGVWPEVGGQRGFAPCSAHGIISPGTDSESLPERADNRSERQHYVEPGASLFSRSTVFLDT